MASDLRMYYQDLVGPEVKAAHLDIVRNNYHIVGKSVTPQDSSNIKRKNI